MENEATKFKNREEILRHPKRGQIKRRIFTELVRSIVTVLGTSCEGQRKSRDDNSSSSNSPASANSSDGFVYKKKGRATDELQRPLN